MDLVTAQAEITALYQNLGLNPDPNGVAQWAAQLMDGTPLSTITTIFAESLEVQNALTTAYQAIYGQPLTTVQLAAAESELASGQTLQAVEAPWVAQALQAITDANQAIHGQPLTTAQLAAAESELASGQTLRAVEAPWAAQAQAEITALYQNLGLNPDPNGVAQWAAQLMDGTPLSTITTIFAESLEVQNALTTAYQAIYGQPLTTVQLAAAESELASGQTLRAVEAPWAAQAQAEITALYQNLGLNPDPNGVAQWAAQLMDGTPLSTITTIFAESLEVQNALTTAYQAIYGQPLTTVQLAAAESELASGQTLQAVEAPWVAQALQAITDANQAIHGQPLTTAQLAAAESGLASGQTLRAVEAPWAAQAQAEITALYQNLGLNPDPNGVAQWAAQLMDGTPLSTITTIFAESLEVQNALTTAYQAIYGQPLTTVQLAAAESELASGQTLQAVEAPWVAQALQAITDANQAIHGQPLTTAQLAAAESELASGQTLRAVEAPWAAQAQAEITALYQNLGLNPDPNGVAQWAAQLMDGTPLSTITTIFAESLEVQNALTTAYQAIYGQPLTTVQLAAAESELASGQTLQAVETPWVAQALQAITDANQAIYGQPLTTAQLAAAESELASGQTLQAVEAPCAAQAQAEITALYQN